MLIHIGEVLLLTYPVNRFMMNMLLTGLYEMPKPKGGRGHTAPYETTHVRVPVDIKPKVERMIQDYRELKLAGTTPESEKYPQHPSAMTLVSFDEAINHAREILKGKKSASDSLAKLLTALYGGEISKEDLK